MSQFISRRAFFSSLAAMAAISASPLVSLPAWAGGADMAVQAVSTALAGDYAGGAAMATKSGSVAAFKLIELFYLREHANDAGYVRIMNFLNASPTWPLRDTLKRRAEQVLFENREAPYVVLHHFADDEPVTHLGSLALARAAYATGDTAKGHRFLRDGWIDPQLDYETELKVLSEFGGKLTREDHLARMARLIYAQQPEAAARQARQHLGSDEQDIADVAKRLIRGDAGAERKFNDLSAEARKSLPLLYTLARFHRRNDNFDKARAIVANVSGNADVMVDAAAWAEERRSIARRSIGPKQQTNWKAAYAIASRHGLNDGNLAIDNEFLAGLVALRYLSDAGTALKHFKTVGEYAESGSDKARASYWMGRAHAEAGDSASARAAYSAAAKHDSVYYGQLAREQLGLGRRAIDISPANAGDDARAAIEKDELVQALRLLAAASDKKDLLNIFLMPLARRFDTAEKLNAVAGIFQTLGGTTAALRFAKAAEQAGHEIDAWNYPITALPNWSAAGAPVERPLVFALSRQESEFNPKAGSSVGAQGLMQLMPTTARLVAKRIGVAFSEQSLHDPEYNVQLGAAHLGDLVAANGGSYVLTLVAYNAGPRRASEWIDYYGDPREGGVDAVDWVECIPFNETRQYVEKVMQNLQMYRSRLAPDAMKPMTADLMRGMAADSIAVGSITPASDCKPRSASFSTNHCG